MASTYNSNDKQLTNTTYSGASFSNPDSKVFPSRLSISYFNKVMKLTIAPKVENQGNNGYASYDAEHQTYVYISATKAKMLCDLIDYMKGNKDTVHNVCIELKQGLLMISDGSELGIETPCISIRSADESGNVKTVTYETKTGYHKGAYNYNVSDNTYENYVFDEIELDVLYIALKEYVKASSYAVAASVMEASMFRNDRVQKTISSIASKVGASSGSGNKTYNSRTFLSGDSDNTPSNTSGNNMIPKEYEASTFDDIANAMQH